MGLFNFLTGKSFKQYKLALNCLMAKATLVKIDENIWDSAVAQSINILDKMGIENSMEKFFTLSEKQRFAIMAFAFSEMGIDPPFEKETWQYVDRPFVLLHNSDMAFNAARRHLKNTYGIDLKFDD